mmetsp:Transcript_6177/g.19790  ORF Transcript_6177/g.19790 Transcript_6177/m.19790 type:complete len:431 (+) Transcript_6177:918-2210(+)
MAGPPAVVAEGCILLPGLHTVGAEAVGRTREQRHRKQPALELAQPGGGFRAGEEPLLQLLAQCFQVLFVEERKLVGRRSAARHKEAVVSSRRSLPGRARRAGVAFNLLGGRGLLCLCSGLSSVGGILRRSGIGGNRDFPLLAALPRQALQAFQKAGARRRLRQRLGRGRQHSGGLIRQLLLLHRLGSGGSSRGAEAAGACLRLQHGNHHLCVPQEATVEVWIDQPLALQHKGHRGHLIAQRPPVRCHVEGTAERQELARCLETSPLLQRLFETVLEEHGGVLVTREEQGILGVAASQDCGEAVFYIQLAALELRAAAAGEERVAGEEHVGRRLPLCSALGVGSGAGGSLRRRAAGALLCGAAKRGARFGLAVHEPEHQAALRVPGSGEGLEDQGSHLQAVAVPQPMRAAGRALPRAAVDPQWVGKAQERW